MPSARPNSRELLDALLDEGSWRSWDEAPHQPEAIDDAYAADLTRAAERAGTDESVVTGEGTIDGRRVALVVSEFSFLAGSIGKAAAHRVVAAIERAQAERLPLLASPASGGTRMQEGTPAFVAMVSITSALASYRAAGLPYLVYLRHPTTGGVFASWGSLGHVTIAEPGALIGFLGPRVYEALYGEKFPDGVQTAENLYVNGIVDAVVGAGELRGLATRALGILLDGPGPVPATAADDARVDVDAWDAVTRSRSADRPGVADLLRAADDALVLRGTGEGEHDESLLLALARLGGQPCVVLGQARHPDGTESPLGPGGLRVARRGMALAQELRLPLVSLVDTAGAALSREAEEGGMAGEIARCIAGLVTLTSPTLCVLLGQGTGGGALALLPADRVVAAQHSWLSPLPPEGAAEILHRDPSRAPELARAQHVRAADLMADGIVDLVVAELPDAAQEPESFCKRLAAVIGEELAVLVARDSAVREADRRARYRRLVD